MINHQDDLTWYLTEGISYFERSTFGSMLDATVMRAFGTQTCEQCDGAGVLDEPWVMTHVTVHRGDSRREYESALPAPVGIPTGKDCPRCHGTGVREERLVPRDDKELTCRPKAEGHGVTKGAPPDEILTRYAFVSRRLGQMPACLSEALQVAYGDDGEASLFTLRGRSWAVTPLTVAGRRLTELHRAKSHGNDNQFRAVAAMSEMADSKETTPETRKLLGEAIEQAAALTKRAEDYWNSLNGGSNG